MWAINKYSPSEERYYKFMGWLSKDGKYIETENNKYKLESGLYWMDIFNPNEKEEILTDIWGETYKARLIGDKKGPYLIYSHTEIEYRYNPEYGDDRVCVCGHSYYRHFDSWENMSTSCCKYCGCEEFVEKTEAKEGK